MHVTQLHSLCGRGHQAFVTEAVPLGELLHEEALFGYRRQKGGSTLRTLFGLPLTLTSQPELDELSFIHILCCRSSPSHLYVINNNSSPLSTSCT